MASLSEAYPAPNIDAAKNERVENPQFYSNFAESVRHVKERRHILGLVGGSGVSRIAGNQADLESDLRGITRPNSDATYRHHLPSKDKEIVRTNPKENVKIDTALVKIQEYQQWAYPSVLAPEPLAKESCYRPEKY
jgi:hypothetical protein